jgi:hypothetical protein
LEEDFKIIRDYLGYMESVQPDPIDETCRQDAISALFRIKERLQE